MDLYIQTKRDKIQTKHSSLIITEYVSLIKNAISIFEVHKKINICKLSPRGLYLITLNHDRNRKKRNPADKRSPFFFFKPVNTRVNKCAEHLT
jgi:hypothetical protein